MAYNPKTYDEIKEEIVINVVQNIDTIVDVNEGSVLDIFISSFSNEFENIYEDLEEIKQSLQISTASGDDLDEIGEASGIKRNEGTAATCKVSFIRSSPATSEFTISQGTLVSTNPNGTNVYTFTTNEEVIFKTEINNLNVNFYNGIFYYKTDNRTFQDLTISGYTNSDYELVKNYNDILIDNTIFELVDDCNDTTGWTPLGDASAITNNTTYYQRYDKSLNLIKTATTSKYFGYEKTDSSGINMEDKQMFMHYRINNSTIKNHIVKLTVYYGTNSTNNYEISFDNSDLSVGGNNGELPLLKLDYKSASTTVNGNPDIENIKYRKIYIELDNSSTTINAGDIIMDFWFVSTSEIFYGDVIKWKTLSTNDSVLNVSYKPLSYDINCTATTIGADGNVAIGEINYKVSSLSNIDSIYNFEAGINGSNKELDMDYRDRIINAAAIRGGSTVPAIEAAIKELSFVKDCVVIDTPEEVITGEKHTYDSSVKRFHLNYEQALDDSNLEITGYVKDTDFELNSATNEIVFDIGGNNPSDNEVLSVNYHCARIGKIKILVTGVTGALTTGQIEQVKDVAVEEVSSGIDYTITSPTYVSTDITATINVDSRYNSTDVKTAVEKLCESMFNTLNIGEDLLIANIINTIAFMPGVTNVTSVLIDGSNSDKTAAKDEILSEGTITINVA